MLQSVPKQSVDKQVNQAYQKTKKLLHVRSASNLNPLSDAKATESQYSPKQLERKRKKQVRQFFQHWESSLANNLQIATNQALTKTQKHLESENKSRTRSNCHKSDSGSKIQHGMKSKPAEQKTKAMELILKRTRSVLEEYQFRLKQCVAEKDTLLLQKEVLKQQLATLKRKGK